MSYTPRKKKKIVFIGAFICNTVIRKLNGLCLVGNKIEWNERK